MTAPPEARIDQQRDGTRLRLTITFPVETVPNGTQRAGRGLPAYFVQSFSVERDGAVLASGHLGPFLSRRPVIELDVDGLAAGERAILIWVDNRSKRVEQSFEAIGAGR